MVEVNSDDGGDYKIESILPEKDSEDQEIFRVIIEVIATNVHGTNLVMAESKIYTLSFDMNTIIHAGYIHLNISE
jgi:hypothetical protein